MKASTFAVAVILIILISGCISQQTKQSFIEDIKKIIPLSGEIKQLPEDFEPQDQFTEPETQNSGPNTLNSKPWTQDSKLATQDQQQPIPDCDSICDDFEKQVKEQSICYKQDCLGIKENVTSTQSSPQQSQQPQQQFNQPPQDSAEIKITKTEPESKYKTANLSKKPSGWFSSGQEADIMLSGIDFNNSGGSLLFNPGRFYLPDSYWPGF